LNLTPLQRCRRAIVEGGISPSLFYVGLTLLALEWIKKMGRLSNFNASSTFTIYSTLLRGYMKCAPAWIPGRYQLSRHVMMRAVDNA